MRYGWIILITQMIVLETAFAQQVSSQSADSLWNKTGSSGIEHYYDDRGRLFTVITNYSILRSFSGLSNLGKTLAYYNIIIAQEERIEHMGFDGFNPTVRAEAFRVYEGKLEKSLWSITEKAQSGKLMGINGAGVFYQTYYFWASDLPPLLGLYNLSTGKRLFYYIQNILSVSKPNTKHSRLIAFNESVPKRDQLIGTLYYSSPDSVLHELNIFEKNPGTFVYFSPDLEFSDIINSEDKLKTETWLDLVSKNFSQDPLAFTGFSVKLKNHPDFEVTIPIVNDDFDISEFTSEIIRIERVK